jgi:hypothetical protein
MNLYSSELEKRASSIMVISLHKSFELEKWLRFCTKFAILTGADIRKCFYLNKGFLK